MVTAMPVSGRILVVDDEPDLRASVCRLLADAGWESVEAGGSAEALAALAADSFAAVVLDVNLRAESGYELCRAIRGFSAIPILFLTARADDFDQALGLDLGGDDCLTKPFNPRILLARVAAAARRNAISVASPDARPIHRARNLSLDPLSRRVWVDEREIEMSRIEFDLLALFLNEPLRAFDRNTIIDRVWGEWFSDDHVIDVTIGRLRRKLAQAGADGLIETVRGVGYRLAAD